MNSKIFATCGIVGFLLTQACGGQSDPSPSTVSDTTRESATAVGRPQAGPMETNGEDPHQALIRQCLAALPDSPFPGGKQPDKELAAKVSVLGFGGSLVDDEVTNTPSFILIDAAVNVLGKVHYDLLNPNGYYCIGVTTNVLGVIDVELKDGARLADSTASVPVAGHGSDGIVNVNVGAAIHVRIVD